jgi:hypothetical protein
VASTIWAFIGSSKDKGFRFRLTDPLSYLSIRDLSAFVFNGA